MNRKNRAFSIPTDAFLGSIDGNNFILKSANNPDAKREQTEKLEACFNLLESMKGALMYSQNSNTVNLFGDNVVISKEELLKRINPSRGEYYAKFTELIDKNYKKNIKYQELETIFNAVKSVGSYMKMNNLIISGDDFLKYSQKKINGVKENIIEKFVGGLSKIGLQKIAIFGIGASAITLAGMLYSSLPSEYLSENAMGGISQALYEKITPHDTVKGLAKVGLYVNGLPVEIAANDEYSDWKNPGDRIRKIMITYGDRSHNSIGRSEFILKFNVLNGNDNSMKVSIDPDFSERYQMYHGDREIISKALNRILVEYPLSDINYKEMDVFQKQEHIIKNLVDFMEIYNKHSRDKQSFGTAQNFVRYLEIVEKELTGSDMTFSEKQAQKTKKVDQSMSM